MLRAYDLMTRSVASAAPKTPISQVASLMRDLNIGDVLVIDQGKLCGIVTDRDLAIHVLTNGATSGAPVEMYMTPDVVTGAADWSIEELADVMGKHQIRRLPIVQDGRVVGIVSLGDLAVHAHKRDTVARSLKNISEVTRARYRQSSPLGKFITLAIPVALGAAALAFANTRSGKQMRKQLSTQWNNNELAEQARHALNDAMDTLQDPRTRQAAFDTLDVADLPERTRRAIQESARRFQKPKRFIFA